MTTLILLNGAINLAGIVVILAVASARARRTPRGTVRVQVREAMREADATAYEARRVLRDVAALTR